jgi:hypothetical protein
MVTFIQAGFIIMTIVMLVLILSELKKGLTKTSFDEARRKSIFNKVLYAIIGWTVLISVLSLSGFLNNFSSFPPRIIIVLVVPLMTLIAITMSPVTREILAHIPAKNIVRLQVFRVFVEILLWMLVVQNLLPVQMSFEGRNFDVISGLTAPFAAYFLVNNRVALIAWNFLTLGLLINILAIAMLSMPTPFRLFMNEPSNTIVTIFPYVWLPGLLVPIAYGLSFLSLRQISKAKNAEIMQPQSR